MKIIKSKMEGDLDLPMLPDVARQAHISDNINNSLVYNGYLCDSRCTVTFKIKYFIVVNKE